MGAGVACILLALISGYFLWRHYRPKPDGETTVEGTQDAPAYQPDSSAAGRPAEYKPADKHEPREVHELMGHYQGAELTNTGQPAEILGVPRVEMELRPERFSFSEGATMDFRNGESTLVPPDESPVTGYLAAASKSMRAWAVMSPGAGEGATVPLSVGTGRRRVVT